MKHNNTTWEEKELMSVDASHKGSHKQSLTRNLPQGDYDGACDGKEVCMAIWE